MKIIIKRTFIIVIALFLLSCNALENLTNSASKIILLSLQGLDLTGAESSQSFCDVDDTANDNATATIEAVCLDPLEACGESTYYQDVVIDQIDIEYSRPDGRDVPGVDVPLPFTQWVHYVVGVGEELSLPFVVIRHAAKLEPPLWDLVELGQEDVLQLTAKITIHGKDIGGHRVQPVTGYLTIWCANFTEEEEPEPPPEEE